MLSTDGLVDAGVVDLVWDRNQWFNASVDVLRAAQHGGPLVSEPVTLPSRAVIACFSVHFPDMMAQLSGAGGKYIIIRRDGDASLVNGAWSACVHHVFAINAIANPRVTPMPTGVYVFGEQEYLVAADATPRTREKRALVAYSLDMPGSVYHNGHERITAIEYFKHHPWASVNERLLGWASRTGPVWSSFSWPDYLLELRKHDYCIVPRGYGVDRMSAWESMALGTIPVSLKHPELMQFSDMAIAFVDRWEDVTAEWCDANLSVIDRPKEKLFLDYWVGRVKEKRVEIDMPEVRA